MSALDGSLSSFGGREPLARESSPASYPCRQVMCYSRRYQWGFGTNGVMRPPSAPMESTVPGRATGAANPGAARTLRWDEHPPARSRDGGSQVWRGTGGPNRTRPPPPPRQQALLRSARAGAPDASTRGGRGAPRPALPRRASPRLACMTKTPIPRANWRPARLREG